MKVSIRKSDVVALKIAYFLLTSYKYRIVVVQNDDKNIWLSNQAMSNFKLIKISGGPSSESFFHREYIDHVKQSVSSTIKMEIDLLEIYTGDEKVEFYKENDIAMWSTYIEAEVPEEITAVFPLVISAFNKIDDANREYEEFKNTISELHNKGNNKVKKVKKAPPIVTMLVIAICIIMYGLSIALKAHSQYSTAIAVVLGAYYKSYIIVLKEYWRFLTCGFIHVELIHLVMNIYVFYFIGKFLEPIIGAKKFTTILLASIVFGSMFEFIGSGNVVCLGLSGGIYGLFAVLIILFIKTGMIKNPALKRQVIAIGLICFLDNFGPNVSWLGHSGGLVCGIFLGIVFLFAKKDNMRKNTIIASVILSAFLLLFVAENQKLDRVFKELDDEVVHINRAIGFRNYGERIKKEMDNYNRR